MTRSPSIFADVGFQYAKRLIGHLIARRRRVQMPQPQNMKPVNGLASARGGIVLADGGIEVAFECELGRLRLVRIGRTGERPIVQNGDIGNPLTVVVPRGRYSGVHGINTFHVNKRYTGDRRLLVFVEHDDMPMQISLDISVEGNVITWLGQALWNGIEPLDADIYFPLLSRVTFDGPATDRAIFPQNSGSTRSRLGEINYRCAYMGSLSSPVFLVEGGSRGLALLDDNRADLAVDAGAAARRVYLLGNRFPLPNDLNPGGQDGPFTG